MSRQQIGLGISGAVIYNVKEIQEMQKSFKCAQCEEVFAEKKHLTSISASEDSDSDEYSVERAEETKYCKALLDGRTCSEDATLQKVITYLLMLC